MLKLPAGTTTISGQSGQSRNTAPGTRSEAATAGLVTAACLHAVTVKMSIANSQIHLRRLHETGCGSLVTVARCGAIAISFVGSVFGFISRYADGCSRISAKARSRFE